MTMGQIRTGREVESVLDEVLSHVRGKVDVLLTVIAHDPNAVVQALGEQRKCLSEQPLDS